MENTDEGIKFVGGTGHAFGDNTTILMSRSVSNTLLSGLSTKQKENDSNVDIRAVHCRENDGEPVPVRKRAAKLYKKRRTERAKCDLLEEGPHASSCKPERV